jgi:hypothetical protein
MPALEEDGDMAEALKWDALVGRTAELRRLQAAIRQRVSQLIWGPADAGKTELIRSAINLLPEKEQKKCIYCAGAASGRQLVSFLIRSLFLAGDPFIRKKVHADGAEEASLDAWIRDQSLLRLRGILFTASERGDYLFFLDHFPPPTHSMAHLMKEIMYRCKTPTYLTGLGYSQAEIGYAWSLYWTDEYRVRLGPLSEGAARVLLEQCIRRFGLSSLDLEGFREDVLRLSRHLPGGIVKMCELAAHPRYHYGDQIKVSLVHVDYLMRWNPSSVQHERSLMQ